MTLSLSGNGITSANITDGAIVNADINASAAIDSSKLSGVNRKNLIINGAMQVAQRGTSFASVTSGAYHLDRFNDQINSLGTWTISQDNNAPDGFADSLKFDCTTADASPGAGDYIFFLQGIEGQNLQHLKKGTASAESLTLSFWVKSNKTGDFQVNLRDNDNSRIIGTTVTIDASATWEQKEVTFAGDTTGALGNDNGSALQVEMWFDAGTNYTSGAVPTSWEASVNTDRAVGTTLALGDSTSNYLNITGIQLELGSTATDFEHRSYGEELALCQRYYWQAVGSDITVNDPISNVCHYSGAACYGVIQYPVEMRAEPSMILTTSNSYWRMVSRAAGRGVDTISLSRTSTKAGLLDFNAGSGTSGDGGWLEAQNTSARMAFNAEL